MPYSPQTWIDNNSSYPLSAARMNNIETGISDAATTGDQGHRILTTAQRDALGSVTAGTMIYNSTLGRIQVYTGSAWVDQYDVTKPSPYQSIQRIAYTQRTTSSTSTATTVGAAGDLFTGGGATGSALTWTADGTSAYLVEFYSAQGYSGTDVDTYLVVALVNGSGTELARLAIIGPSQVAGKRGYGQVHARYFYTPAAGSTTINIRYYGFATATGSVSLQAGAGGAGNPAPMYLAVFGPPLV